MTTLLPIATTTPSSQATPELEPSADAQSEIFYPGSDGEPLAETSIHLDAIITIVISLRQFLAEQGAKKFKPDERRKTGRSLWRQCLPVIAIALVTCQIKQCSGIRAVVIE